MRRLTALCGALGVTMFLGAVAHAQLHPDYKLTLRRPNIRTPQVSRQIHYKKPIVSRLPDTTRRVEVRLPNKRVLSVSRRVNPRTPISGRRILHRQPVTGQFQTVEED